MCIFQQRDVAISQKSGKLCSESIAKNPQKYVPSHYVICFVLWIIENVRPPTPLLLSARSHHLTSEVLIYNEAVLDGLSRMQQMCASCTFMCAIKSRSSFEAYTPSACAPYSIRPEDEVDLDHVDVCTRSNSRSFDVCTSRTTTFHGSSPIHCASLCLYQKSCILRTLKL